MRCEPRHHFLVFISIGADHRKIFCSPGPTVLLFIIKNYTKILCGKFSKFNSLARTSQHNNVECMKTKLMTIYWFTPAFVRDLAIVNRTCWKIHWIRGEHNARKRRARDVFLSIGITTWNFEPCRFAFNWVHQIQFAAFNRPLVDKFKAFNTVTHVGDEKESAPEVGMKIRG